MSKFLKALKICAVAAFVVPVAFVLAACSNNDCGYENCDCGDDCIGADCPCEC